MRLTNELKTKKFLQARLTDPLFVSVSSLGIHQITAWGTSYYCPGILAVPRSFQKNAC